MRIRNEKQHLFRALFNVRFDNRPFSLSFIRSQDIHTMFYGICRPKLTKLEKKIQ